MKTIKKILAVLLMMFVVFGNVVLAEDTTTPEKPIDIDELVTTTRYFNRYVTFQDDIGADAIEAVIYGYYTLTYNPSTGLYSTSNGAYSSISYVTQLHGSYISGITFVGQSNSKSITMNVTGIGYSSTGSLTKTKTYDDVTGY